jgi:small subunit ribosomal protein S20
MTAPATFAASVQPHHQQRPAVANSAQARKRARQADAQRAHNTTLRSALRTAIKKVRTAIAAGNKADAQAAFNTSVSVIDRIADKGIVHKNKAARHKSRLSAAVKAIA